MGLYFISVISGASNFTSGNAVMAALLELCVTVPAAPPPPKQHTSQELNLITDMRRRNLIAGFVAF